VQSVPIATKVVSLNPTHRKVYLGTTLCDKVHQWFAAGRWFSPGVPVSSIDKTDHDIAEILLKVVLNTITHTLNLEELDIYKVIFYNVQVPIILNKEI
jgi:hypothetical protein